MRGGIEVKILHRNAQCLGHVEKSRGAHQRHEKPVVQGASKDNTASEDDAPPPLEV